MVFLKSIRDLHYSSPICRLPVLSRSLLVIGGSIRTLDSYDTASTKSSAHDHPTTDARSSGGYLMREKGKIRSQGQNTIMFHRMSLFDLIDLGMYKPFNSLKVSHKARLDGGIGERYMNLQQLRDRLASILILPRPSIVMINKVRPPILGHTTL